MNWSSWKLLWILLMLTLVLVGCGGQPTPEPIVVVVTPPPPQAEPTTEPAPPPPPDAGIQVLEATYAHGLSEEMQPLNPGADFGSAETVYLSLKIKGRPQQGLVSARFYWHEDLIAEAAVDLADTNSGLLFSFGEDTYVGYTLTHDEPFPLSDQYRAEVLFNGQPLGTYPFRVVPPPEAILSQVTQVTLARGADENYNPIEPTTAFAFDEEVYLVGQGDLGLGTWLQAEWYVNGQLDPSGTRHLPMDENIPGAGFIFSFLPEGGWPAGEHFAVLTMNDQEVGRYALTVVSSGGAAPLTEPAFWDAFPMPEDAESVPVVEGYDLGYATIMSEPQLFDTYAGWLRDQGWEQQAPTEAMQTLPHQVWRKEGFELLLEVQGLDEQGRTILWAQMMPLE